VSAWSTQQVRSAATGLTIGFGLAANCWFAIELDHPVFAITVQGGFLFMALLLGPALVDVGRSRYRVRASEPRLYALLGAELVRRVLDVVGWNRMIGRMRHSESGDSMLARFLRGAEQSETAHLLGAAATALVAVVATTTGHIQGAVQILLVGFVLHGYPVMIQRMVRFRITNRRRSRPIEHGDEYFPRS
jgi:DMSO reductase anchor subunit